MPILSPTTPLPDTTLPDQPASTGPSPLTFEQTLDASSATLRSTTGDQLHSLLTSPIPAPLGHHPMTPTHEQICLALAAGFSHSEIATSLNLSPTTLRTLVTRADILERVRQLQLAVGLDAVRKRFDTLIPTAIATAESLMRDSTVSPSTRATIAFSFMDRALGKPTQPLETRSTLLSDLITKLNHETCPPPAPLTAQVQPAAPVPDSPSLSLTGIPGLSLDPALPAELPEDAPGPAAPQEPK